MRHYVIRFHREDPDRSATHPGYGGRGWYAHHIRSGYILRVGFNYGCFMRLSHLMDHLVNFHARNYDWLAEQCR